MKANPALQFMLSAALLVSVAPLAAQSPARPDEQRLVAEAQRMWDGAAHLAQQHQWAPAIAAARDLLDFQRTNLGGDSIDTCTVLEQIASWHQANSDLHGALAVYDELQQAYERVFGADHWRTVTVRVQAKHLGQIARLGPDELNRLEEAAALADEAEQLHAQGKDRQAVEKTKAALQNRLDVLGEQSAVIATTLNAIGLYLLGMEAYGEAGTYLERSVRAHEQVFGDKHPQTLAARNNLCVLYGATRAYDRAIPKLQRLLTDANDLYGADNPATVEVRFNLGSLSMMAGKLDDAEPELLSALRRQESIFGPEHSKVAKTKDCLGLLYAKKADYQQALRYLTSSVQLFETADGEMHPNTAAALRDLGNLHDKMGNFAEAERCLQKSLDIRSQVLGEVHTDTAAAVDDLAHLYEARGDLGNAARLFRRELEIQLQLSSPDDIKVARTQACLGSVYLGMRDFGKAQSFLEPAVVTYRNQLGDHNADTAQTMQILGNCYKCQWHDADAERLYKAAIDASENSLGADDPQTAAILTNLANLYERGRKYAQAASLYQRAFRTLEKLGDRDPRAGLTLSYLARIAYFQGDFAEARSISNRALGMLEQSLDPGHYQMTDVYCIAALAELALANVDGAAGMYRRALDAVQSQCDANAAMQPERQQLAVAQQMRYALDMYLSLPADRVPADEVYRHLLVWKGAIQARQVRDLHQRGSNAAPLAAELQNVCTQLTSLSLKLPEAAGRDAWLKQIGALKERRENLEADLAYLSRDYRAQQAAAAVTPEQVQAALPPGTALVDVIDNLQLTVSLENAKPELHHENRYMAFIIRADRPIERVDLGPTRPIDEATDQWRAARGFIRDKTKADPAVTLRDLFWAPLEPHLRGCKTLLFSPDGYLTRFPLGVLPGREPGSFLIEDIGIAVIPVPQLLPEIVRQSSGPQATVPSMLLIGDVDYNAVPGQSTAPDQPAVAKEQFEGGQLLTFEPLKATGPEVESLAQRFQQHFPDARVCLFEKSAATEAAFRETAPQSKWLLVATHGFFAPPGINSALAVQDRMVGMPEASGFHCGTLSGLALAGANTPSTADTDDGILTAAEVSSLDLRNVDLAVLSGCETGLGQLAGAEGALGLQRAFQVAGARTTVTSLWKVPDQRTSQIVQRFYANLWDKKMSKLDALREAQIWMMRTGGKEAADGQGESGGTGKRLPPYQWAAFVLSGDWR